MEDTEMTRFFPHTDRRTRREQNASDMYCKRCREPRWKRYRPRTERRVDGKGETSIPTALLTHALSISLERRYIQATLDDGDHDRHELKSKLAVWKVSIIIWIFCSHWLKQVCAYRRVVSLVPCMPLHQNGNVCKPIGASHLTFEAHMRWSAFSIRYFVMYIIMSFFN